MRRARALAPLLLRAPRQPLAVDAHHAAVRLVEAGQTGQQRRLAGPGGPGDGDHLALLDGERDALQGERLVVAGVEEPVQALCLEQRGHRDHVTESVTIFHGSTLSAPFGPESVRITSLPL